MKYAVYSEYEPIHRDKIMERAQLYMKEREEKPDKYPKVIFDSHNLGGSTKSIMIVEGSYEQLLNQRQIWLPYQKSEFIPLYKSAELAEKYPTTKI
jgi:hypothetical protein